MRVIRVLLLGMALCLSVAAQGRAGLTSVDVVVRDSTGTPVKGLSRDSFIVLEGTEARDIEAFSAPDTPWNILLLFDHSLTWLQDDENRRASSTYVVDTWRAMAESISRFLTHLNPRDRVAIAAFEENVEVLMDWRNAQSGKSLDVRFNAVVQPPKGLKDLYGAMEWSVSQLRGAKGRKAVIVFTDGRDGRLAPQWLVNDKGEEIFDPLFGLSDSGEADEFRKTGEIVRSSGVRFFFLTVKSNHPPDVFGRPISGMFPGTAGVVRDYVSKVQRRMERFAELSKGQVMYANAPADAIVGYSRLYGDLMLDSLYTLEFSRGPNSNDLPDPIQVRVKEQNLRAFYSRNP